MPSDSLVLPVPDAFPSFPYTPPYPIQVDLMKHVYCAIEHRDRKVAIVESPTGTGKTLSLLCSTLTWLVDDKARIKRGQLQVIQDALRLQDEPTWVLEQTLERYRREFEVEEEDLEQRLEKARKKELALRKMARAHVHKKQKVLHQPSEDGDDSFLPEDEPEESFSPAVRALMQTFANSRTKEDAKELSCTKVYYTSRTHSQLAQLRSELLKTSHSSVRMVPLASRQNLCINESLRGKGDNAIDLDEGCRKLLNEPKAKRCPYLPPPDEEYKMLELKDHILAMPRDIEDLVTIGKRLETCPYFGSRRAIAQAQLVTLPYNLLLHKSARDSLGIDLSNNVVVVDEAHNLVDTLLAVHTVSLSAHTLDASFRQLTCYLHRFRRRLAPTHELHLRRLLRFLGALKGYVDNWTLAAIKRSITASKHEVIAASNLMSLLGNQVDGVNLLEIEAYLKRSKIARKISGYSDKAAGEVRRQSPPPLSAVESFILALTNNDADGRLTLTIQGDMGQETAVLKYQLLNPSNHFKEVVNSARCVVLAGGTMSPINDFRLQLYPFLTEQQVSVFTCGHVIPSTNLHTMVIGRGPGGGNLQFKYDRRDDQQMFAELGNVLLNLVNLIPHGLVVFFPSYAFLNSVRTTLRKYGFLDKLNHKKTVFFEPEGTDRVDDVLRQYGLAISTASANQRAGALLFAVVGAKLSEGINFSDTLARGVVIVGLPYPSLASVELKERMRYVTELEKASDVTRSLGARDAGTELYENLCMKSVNQSIGRAIRHRHDFASLILVDMRYASPRISGKLPKWISENLIISENFGHAVKEIGQFFRTKTKQDSTC